MTQAKEQSKTKKSLSATKKKIYIIIIIIGNAVAFYLIFSSFFGGSSRTPSPVSSNINSTVNNQQTIGTGNDFKSFIDKLKEDLSVLSDSRFKLLRSLGIEIKAPNPGRENPFQPY